MNKQSYQEARPSRKSRRVVQPLIETEPVRAQKAAPQVMEMIDVQDVISEQPKPTMQMLPTPQAKAAQPVAPQQKVAHAMPKVAMPAAGNAEIVRPKIHEGVNQINYTASLGKSGALVHVVETKPVEATLSGKIITPQIVDGQMQQTERALSTQEAQMYHQKIKAAAAA